MSRTDQIGERGELICRLRLTSFVGEKQLFRPAFLGEKWPDVDLLVEMVEPTRSGRRGFFFAQVKATRMGYLDNGRLKIPAVDRARVEALGAYAIPTYLLGVDEPRERVYIVAVQGRLAGMSSMSHDHELTRERLPALRDEIEAYWDRLGAPLWRSRFQESHWGEAS